MNNGKTCQREVHKQSQSPEDQNSSKGLLQRIQMKNLAFIPAKLQPSLNQNLQYCNITNVNINHNNQCNIKVKQSPERLISEIGNKMIIPANQIRLVKKDGTSPSPEARQPQWISPPTSIPLKNHNNQSINSNNLKGGSTTSYFQNNQQSKLKKNSIQHQDDETNVNSDNEEKVSNLFKFKPESSNNNFNRPKFSNNTNQHSGNLQDQTMIQQRTQRGSPIQQTDYDGRKQRVKIINQKDIRKSPSPPPQHANNANLPLTVTNVCTLIKQQQQQQQQETQPQLASDYIKGMITQSRANNMQGQNCMQKQVIGNGSQNCVKVNKIQANFAKDMKKHGISKDVQDISKFNHFLSENSPSRQDENTNVLNSQSSIKPLKLQIKKFQHIRNYSPPLNSDKNNINGLLGEIVIKDSRLQQNQIPQEISQSNLSTQNDEQLQITQGDQGTVFQFPFQRRARSLSLPKQEIIQNKMNQRANQNLQTGQNGNTSQSPQRPLDTQNSRRIKPVVANVNFVIAQKGVMKQQDDDDSVFERNKEVDEWLMGSGESAATSGSVNSLVAPFKGKVGVAQALQNQQTLQKKSVIEKPVELQKEDENDLIEDEEEEGEDWMFKTFDLVKAKKKNPGGPSIKATNTNDSQRQIESNRGFIFNENEEEESPFDMAPEMQRQFQKEQTKMSEDCYLLDHIASDCNDLSQYMVKIDQFMMENIL